MNVCVIGVGVRCFRVGMHLRPDVGIIFFKYMDLLDVDECVCVNEVDIRCFRVIKFLSQ